MQHDLIIKYLDQQRCNTRLLFLDQQSSHLIREIMINSPTHDQNLEQIWRFIN